jgi:hypothetical protein
MPATIARWRDHTPMLIDDVISTARTMIEALIPARVLSARTAWYVNRNRSRQRPSGGRIPATPSRASNDRYGSAILG